MIPTINQHLDTIIKFANIIALIYALWRFTRKPHDTLEERVKTLEVKQIEIEHKLMQGNDKFRSHGKVLEILVTCTLALINFEVHYCETEHKEISQDLEDARQELNKCLSKINKDDE